MLYRILGALLLSTSLFGLPSETQTLSYENLEPGCGIKTPFWRTGQQAFNAAPEIGSLLVHLKKKYSLTVAVETGTFKGNTTTFFADLFPKVYSVEANKALYRSAKKEFADCDNLTLVHGSSADALPRILSTIRNARALFYLDAHWGDDWPLREELQAIAKTHRDRCVIVIDDFKVPGREDLPFDYYGNRECSLEYIQDLLPAIFSSYKVLYVIPRSTGSHAKCVLLPL